MTLLYVLNRHMVIRVTPETKEQMDFLLHLQSTSSIDFWSLSASKDGVTDIRVSPDSYEKKKSEIQNFFS